jgi:phosphoheptose isomerase
VKPRDGENVFDFLDRARTRDMKVIAMMEKFGGSFVASLAEAFKHADPDNFRRLRQAFPEYWHQYEKMLEDPEA